MLDGLQKISEDIVIRPYVKWALDPQCPEELREISKHTVIGYTLAMLSTKKISNMHYYQIMHELRNGEEG
jgi:hypothetical protein